MSRQIRSLFWFAVVLALIISSQVTTVVQGQQQLDLNKVNADLQRLEPYVKYITTNNGMRVQTFNAKAALKNGFSSEVVALAGEIVDYQNSLAKAGSLSKTGDVSDLQVPVQKGSRLAELFVAATNYDPANSSSPAPLASVNPCGDWSHPVPNSTPSWSSYTSSKPETTLLSWGFHHTASYACGYGNCSTSDFTRGRSYTGSYGTCSSPRFRDQGRITGSTAFKIQYGEPNPEIFSYSWPYWNWGAYVKWWHDNH